MLEPFVRQRPDGEIEAQFMVKVERLTKATMEGLADAIIEASPVDTGTYVTSHAVYEGSTTSDFPAFFSSLGRPRGQDENQMRAMGRAKLSTFIENLDFRESSFVFGNESEHRHDVENIWRYKVFTAAARAFPAAVQSAKAQVGTG